LSRPEACLFAALAACLILWTGCQPQARTTPEIELDWSVKPNPPVAGPVLVSLTLTDAKTGGPVRGAEVRLEGNMSHPGMKPVFSTAREVGPGRYEAPIELTMGGDWFILIEATLRDGRALQRQVDVRGVRSR